jgi:non-specific serine/threonine protein kinase/serine/threonine-protein kinase
MSDNHDDTVLRTTGEPVRHPGAQLGEVLGPYTLRERIAVGGMGEVWLAEQAQPFRRRVAVKLIKAGMDTSEVLKRFETERQALALMDHPCIAKVFDAGSTAEGRPYFVMEYVHGLPIDEYCDKRRLDTRERLELFQKVCHGVQHAHQKAVLHRDLKPSNVLVADIDGEPSPKIIDFGVAKATSRRLTDASMHTSIGQLIGTPEYMSPEQAEFSSEDVDTRTDVYSLGVILYELLVGCLPFDPEKLRTAGLEMILKTLRETDPPRPSTRLQTDLALASKSAKARRTQVRRLSTQVRGDLDWIVLRAMDKDRNRRYGSPSELAQDIERHLNDEAVVAGPPTVRYRASKFVRRHRGGVLAASVGVLGLLTFAIVTGYQAQTIARERDRAEAEASKTSAMNDFLTGMLSEANPWTGGGRDYTVAAALDAATREIDTSFEGQPQVEASLRAALGETYLGLEMLDPAQVQIDRATTMQVELSGEIDREVGRLRAMQSLLAQRRADYPTAVQRAATAAEIFRQDPSSTDAELLEAYQRQARNLLYARMFDQADSVLAICDELAESPEMHQDLRSAENFSLRADLLVERDGDAAAAEALSRRAYERARAVDPSAGQVAVYMNNTAQYHSRSGDLDGALVDFDSTLAVSERIFGKDHPQYATAVENRGGVLYQLGRPDETLAALEEVLEIRKRNLGPDHVDVLRTTINTGTVAMLADNNEEALRIFGQLLPRLIEARGEEHPDVVIVMRNTGLAYGNLERHVDAERVLRRALVLAEKMFEDDDPRVSNARADVGVALHQQGRNAEAYEFLVRAFAVNVEKLGADHPRTRSNAEFLVKVCGELGRTAEAAEYEQLLGE